MEKKKHPLFNIGMTLVCFCFILCTSIFIVLLLKPLYSIDLKLLKIPEISGVPYDICKKNYGVLIDYNLLWGPDRLVFPDFIMSENAAVHFEEVRTIFHAAEIASLVSIVLMAAGYPRAKKLGSFGWLPAAVTLILAVAAVVGFGCIFYWDQTFVLMHHILFRNDFWLFDPALDPVITILPDEVFLHLGAAIIAVMVIFMVIGIIVYRKNTARRAA